MAATLGSPAGIGDEHFEGADQDSKEKIGKKENEAEETLCEERNNRWEMVFTAWIREIAPGLFLGNFKASYNQEMLRKNCINAIVSLTDARWVW